nr:MAG TPA: hypothetical protein [Bacteriophage sp.]
MILCLYKSRRRSLDLTENGGRRHSITNTNRKTQILWQ